MEQKKHDEFCKRMKELASLCHLVSVVTHELSNVQKETEKSYEEKLAEVWQVSGSIAQQIRNPLTVIESSLYFLKEKLKGTTDEKIKKHLDIIDNQVWISNQIINDFLDFTSTRSLSLLQTDVNRIIRDVLMDFKTVEDTIIKTLLDENLPIMVLDPAQILRVFRNIISNSLQAMPEGGELDIRTRMKDDFVEVEFKDTGEGIPEENIRKIFEPLFTTKAKGIGLGLTVMKNIINEHNGSILVQSEIGKGTTFTVKLPTNK